MAATISANVDNATALKLKIVAATENRSISNAVSSAITVFIGLPKGVRDLLLELNSQNDQETIMKLGREMMVASARVRLEKATADIASERAFGGPDVKTSEIEMMEEATELSRSALSRPR
jgi:hypothetical protein